MPGPHSSDKDQTDPRIICFLTDVLMPSLVWFELHPCRSLMFDQAKNWPHDFHFCHTGGSQEEEWLISVRGILVSLSAACFKLFSDRHTFVAACRQSWLALMFCSVHRLFYSGWIQAEQLIIVGLDVRAWWLYVVLLVLDQNEMKFIYNFSKYILVCYFYLWWV